MSNPISPLRYPGGKSRAVKKFNKYVPTDVTTLCSPFLGGGSFVQIEDSWQQAAVFFILNRTSFSGWTVSGGFSSLETDGRNGRFKESNVEFLRNFRVPEGMLNVEFASFEESILRHPRAFLYADPPYS